MIQFNQKVKLSGKGHKHLPVINQDGVLLQLLYSVWRKN